MFALLTETLVITFFIFTMMLVIEFFNVWSKGALETYFKGRSGTPVVWAAFFGIIPGCLGAYTVVTLYVHRLLRIGGVVACMIATTGEAAFLMLALFPRTALVLFAVLFVLGVTAGWLVDRFSSEPLRHLSGADVHGLEIHHDLDFHEIFNWRQFIIQWRRCRPERGILSAVFAFLLAAMIFGDLGHEFQDHWHGRERQYMIEEPIHDETGLHDAHESHKAAPSHPDRPAWITYSLILVFAVGLFIVALTSDHFLEDHLWRHVVMKHVPRLFLWVGVSLALIHGFTHFLDLEVLIDQNLWWVLVAACLIGLLPDISPQLIFVSLFATGHLPFPILLASSIVQDGHGLLPMLAHSRRTFLCVKGFNFCLALTLGAVLLLFWKIPS